MLKMVPIASRSGRLKFCIDWHGRQLVLALSVVGITLFNLSSPAWALVAASEAQSSLPSKVKKTAVVVGGGPIGLATALTLSNEPHCYDVTILEQSSVEQYDPTKAYLYNVNARGQVWMKDTCPSAYQKLQERGVVADSVRFTIVPASPDEPIPKGKKLLPMGAKEQSNETRIESYWIPRHSMVCVLEEVIEEQKKLRSKPNQKESKGSVELKKGRFVAGLEPLADGRLEVSVESGPNGTRETYEGSLVVAADGFNSKVRELLADRTKKTWLHSKPNKFKVKKWVSPASGLRMKVLQMPPGFTIPDADGSTFQTENEYSYAIRGIHAGPKNYISLGMLPVKDPSMVRAANVITRPCHEIWQLTSGESVKAWFTNAFPRLRWDDYVDDAEWERFSKAPGTTFPSCQYSPALQVSSPDEMTGVVLVGDAVHAFPPDIGQGINAGLCDVVALDRALRGKDILSGEDQKPAMSLGAALKEYERVQSSQVKALIRLSRFGSPYQYRQPLRKDRIGRKLLVFNVLMRKKLNQLTFGLIQPSAMVLLQNPKLSYRQVMQRADTTTTLLWGTLFLTCWTIFGSSLKSLLRLP